MLGRMEVGGGVTSIAGAGVPVVSVRGGLLLAPGWLAWAGGSFGTEAAVPEDGESAFEVRFGWGGFGFERRIIRSRLEGSLQLFMGAGHARVQTRFAAVEAGTRNVWIVEPGMGVRYRATPWLATGVEGRWRRTGSAEELPGLLPGDLSGGSLLLSVRLSQPR